MTVWAIVPVKPLAQSKSRLAGVLSTAERAELSARFLEHVLRVLNRPGGRCAVAQTLVISRDPAVLALARAHQAQVAAEAGRLDLNAALTQATRVARAGGAQAVLILPTDLPFFSAADVEALTAAGAEGPLVAIAPDRHETGTNALFVRPPELVAYAFGPGSFAAHLGLAQQAGAAVRICRLPGLALDVDEPEDLALYRAALITHQ